MPLVVTMNGEARRSWEHQGSTIYFTPCGWGEHRKLEARYRDSTTLFVDSLAVKEAVVLAHVIAWEGVLDESGHPIAFTQERLLCLSPAVIGALYLQIVEPVTRERALQGNSPGSSDT